MTWGGSGWIKKYTSGGKLITRWGGPFGDFGAYYPTEVATDSGGNVYANNPGRILKFTPKGRSIDQIGTGPRSGDGQLRSPGGIAVSPSTSAVYVVDSGNHRIQWFVPGRGAGRAREKVKKRLKRA